MCSNIASINIPDMTNSIGVSAFSGCSSLVNINIPNNVNNIGDNAFYGCNNLENIEVSTNNTYYISIDGILFTKDKKVLIKYPPAKKNTEYTIPNSVVQINKYAFESCNLLEAITISNNVTDILNYTFDNCSALNNVHIPNSVKVIGESAFRDCRNINNMIIPNSVTSIGISAFNDCYNLENLEIPSSVVSISDYAFLDCHLKHIHIPQDKNYSDYINKGSLPNTPSYYFPGGCNNENCPLIAHENKVETTYIVSWVNDDGKTIYTEEVNVGEHPTYNTEKWGTPVSSTGNVFKGWANIPETENNIVIPVFSSTDTSYTGNGGDITYYAIYGDFVNVKWYNGNTLLEDNYCKENTVPVYGGEIPKCYDYEYGLVRKFLGWTTVNNSNYSITISDKLVPVTEDTIYYAVFSEEEPVADDSMNMDIDKLDYIEQHITSASAKEWTKLNQAILLKDTVENSTLEVTHGIWKTVAITDKVVNLDYMGIYGEISANDYNLILLDMFNSVEGYETVSSIIKESSYSGIKDWANILKKSLTKVFGDDLKLDKDLNKAFNTFDKEPTYQNMLNLIDETNAFCEKNNMDLSEMVVSQSLLEMYELTNDILSGINLAVSTLKDVIENAEIIAAYRTYQNMSQEYLDLLIDLYKEADNISSNSWEVADLKNAIRYQIYYYAYPDEATLKSMVNIIAKNLIQVFSGDIDDIIKDHTINFIQKTFTKDVTVSSKYLKGEIGTYLAAVQNGFKYGVKISDKLFDMNNREELYIKVKEYGVLNEILYKVLDSKANKLLSAKTMDEQYSAANYYDKAYKMYFFIESVACKNAGEYEKTFELPDGIKRALQKYIGTDLIYNILYNESLDEAAARHAEMATIYNNYANFINRNLHCHYGYKIGADEYVDILLNYSQTMKDHKVAIISCPVQVNVYDENKSLVGTLSSQYTNVKQGYEIYMYRIEETDSNVVCIPTDYTIEVIGLDNGTMNVIAGFFDGNEQLNTVSYNNVPIDSEYRAILNIDEKTSDLSENVPNSPSHTTPSMPSIDNNQETSSSTNAISTNSSKSTTFNVKVENKITNKTTKVKATRTGENVTINLGKDNNGYYANAYTSDTKLIDAVKIKSGKAKFTIPNDIDFYIIVDEASHLDYEDVSSGAGIHELLNETTTLLCITVIIIITVVGCLSIVAIKRFDKNKH